MSSPWLRKNGMLIRARAPLRLGLAGGGSDVSPYCETYGGCVLNATIDRYAYAILKPTDDGAIRFNAADQQQSETLPRSTDLPLTSGLRLHRAVYNEIASRFNGGKPLGIELTTYCDAPVGSGLGASSTIVVVMIKAFAEMLNLPLDDYSIAQMAYKIERIDCSLQGGRQDQYAAAFGGFNFMEFYEDDRAIINTLRIKDWIVCELEASTVLFYTGISRESATIISDQSRNVTNGEDDAIEAMHGLKREAVRMKECVLKGDFTGMIGCINDGWTSKKRSARTVSNPHIDELFAAAMSSGALAGKVSGAGGGGFMMFFVPPERRMDVIATLSRFPGAVSNCHFTMKGAEAWRV